MAEELQNKLDSYQRQRISRGIMGEVLARYENHVSIDKNVVDAWEIPALRIDTKYTDNEFNMARDAVDTSDAAGRGRRALKCWRRITSPIRRGTAFTNWARAAWATIRRPAC